MPKKVPFDNNSNHPRVLKEIRFFTVSLTKVEPSLVIQLILLLVPVNVPMNNVKLFSRSADTFKSTLYRMLQHYDTKDIRWRARS